MKYVQKIYAVMAVAGILAATTVHADVWSDINVRLTNGWTHIAGKSKAFGQKFREDAKEAWSEIKKDSKTVAEKTRNGARKFGGQFKQTGRDVANDFKRLGEDIKTAGKKFRQKISG